MKSRIKGITVTLIEKTKIGQDPFGAPIYQENFLPISNVLIGEPDTQAITDELNLTGKKIAYVLAIPKEDEHEWEDTFVEFFGERFRTIGKTMQGIEENIKLPWTKKVKVERYGKSED